jgi:hypothetical protein
MIENKWKQSIGSQVPEVLFVMSPFTTEARLRQITRAEATSIAVGGFRWRLVLLSGVYSFVTYFPVRRVIMT